MDMVKFLEAITEEMKAAILANANGSEFAAYIIQKHGPTAFNAYNEVSKWGDQILQRVSMYPPLGSFYAEHPAEFERFMGEFLDANMVQQLLQSAIQPGPRRVVRPKTEPRTDQRTQ